VLQLCTWCCYKKQNPETEFNEDKEKNRFALVSNERKIVYPIRAGYFLKYVSQMLQHKGTKILDNFAHPPDIICYLMNSIKRAIIFSSVTHFANKVTKIII
jgi:hypothetical protein